MAKKTGRGRWAVRLPGESLPRRVRRVRRVTYRSHGIGTRGDSYL